MKALATPLLGAGIAFGVKEQSISVLLATILVAASLWVLEAIWKGFQYCLTDRIIRLEEWFVAKAERTNRHSKFIRSGGEYMLASALSIYCVE